MKYKKSAVKILLIIFLFALFGSSFFGNIWGCLIDPAYYIPKESNTFIFNAKVMQNGSSDAWIYGEDYNNYYYNSGLNKKEIISLSKEEAKKCPDFNALNIKSWCGIQQASTSESRK
ncbi:hypothetical protein [Flavobacterium sp. CLA17]|uniref:hypothetical protein n=1 Tax=Flavobacterium sp. CLA17 TaxID=2724135 RepID=UPI00149160D3|nr:hypothetical protein [Flavobacterium sp. CLA17]QSB28557.1 hypothetical protein HAV12_007430 [Flavobacterium sp. CLA17]